LEFETVTQRVSGITEEINQLRRLIEQKKLEETRSKTNLDVLRAEYATALGKKARSKPSSPSMDTPPNLSAASFSPASCKEV